MSLRNKFVLYSAFISAIFIFAMVYDRVLTAKTEMLERANSRVNDIVSFVSDVTAERLEAGGSADLQRILKGLGHFERIAYLRVSDAGGRIMYRMARPGMHIGDRKADLDIFSSADRVFDVRRDIVRDDKRLGMIELGFSVEGIRESGQLLMWRGVTLGTLFFLLLFSAMLLLARKLSQHFEALAALAGAMDSEVLPQEPKLDPATDAGKIAFTLRELHSRLKTEERRRRAAEAQKEDFFAMTIHDLKQPLTGLKAAMDLLSSKEEMKTFGERQKETLFNIASESLSRLDTMMVDALNMSKINGSGYSPDKERISLDGFMRELAEANSLSVKAAGRKWHFVLPPEAADAWIFGEKDMLKRVIGNLVLNSIQYTPKNGAIQLGVRFPSTDRAAIFVSDEGEGIPENFREEIFKKYKGLGKDSKNLGLGLAFCRMVADSHSAVIDVRSEPGQGTEISLVIAVSRAAGMRADKEVGDDVR